MRKLAAIEALSRHGLATARMLDSITLEAMKTGEVELTKIGDGWVCGEARIATKDSTFTGKFAAKLVAAK